MTHSAVYVGDNAHVLELVGLKDHTGAVLEGATVQLTSLVDLSDSSNVGGITLPLALSHTTGGRYEGILPAGLPFVAGRTYRAKVRAENAGLVGEWTETLVARVRHA